MNISFDLDNTLIPYSNEFETEKRSFIAKLLGVEKIRKGTQKLIFDLKKEGHQIHIYTTSYRSKRKIRRTFHYYKIRLDKIVNQNENQKMLKSLHIKASKYPKAFGFDLHIDDLIGVGIEAERFNFKAIIIAPSDKNWVQKIKKELKKSSL